MKLEPVTKLDKRNTATSKNHHHHHRQRRCRFSDLSSIWSNKEAGFRTDGL